MTICSRKTIVFPKNSNCQITKKKKKIGNYIWNLQNNANGDANENVILSHFGKNEILKREPLKYRQTKTQYTLHQQFLPRNISDKIIANMFKGCEKDKDLKGHKKILFFFF